jgi:predicted dinucleotide-binding enzyme
MELDHSLERHRGFESPFALAVAREALPRGHQIVLCSRTGPDALAGKVAELGRGASAASVEEAASLDYVLLAVPWNNIEAALRGLPEWNGRVLIDATNPFVETSPKLVLADLGGIGASEIVLVSREERASSRRSIPSSWPASTWGRSRAKASA